MIERFFCGIESIGVSRDTAFATIVTLTTFVSGYVITRLMELSKERKHLKEVRELAVAYLASVLEPITKQSTALKKLAEGISRTDQDDFVFQQSSIRPDFLASIPQLDLFRSFLLGPRDEKKARIKSFNELQETLDFLRRQDSASQTEFLDFVSKFNRYVETFRTQTNQLLRYHDSFLQEARVRGVAASNDPFLREFNRLVHALAQSNRTNDIPFVLTTFVEPIRQLARTYSSDPRSVLLLTHVVEASTAAKNRDTLISIYSKYFVDGSDSLATKIATIERARKLLSH